jgi:hypothetical protein
MHGATLCGILLAVSGTWVDPIQGQETGRNKSRTLRAGDERIERRRGRPGQELQELRERAFRLKEKGDEIARLSAEIRRRGRASNSSESRQQLRRLKAGRLERIRALKGEKAALSKRQRDIERELRALNVEYRDRRSARPTRARRTREG